MISPRQWGQPGASLYCACHTKPSRGPTAPTSTITPQDFLCTGKKYSLLRLPCDGAASRAAAKPRRFLYCACHREPSRGASRGPAAPTGAEASRRDLFGVLNLGRERQSGNGAIVGGFVQCACYADNSQEAFGSAPATGKPAAAHACGSSARKIFVSESVSEEDEWRWVGDWVIDWVS